MTEAPDPRRVVSTTATVRVRPRPALLLMVVRVRAAEATLELGLAEVKQRSADAAGRLTRLGAARVWAGEPHPDDHANLDPVARMRAAARPRRRPAGAGPAERGGVNIAVTATWEIAGLSAEEVLLLVDRLQFDAAANADPPDPADLPDDLPRWAGPEEQIQQMVARAMDPPPEDRSPKFLYIARPTDEQLMGATAEAYALTRQKAERLAGAVGGRLGRLESLTYGAAGTAGRADRLLEQQRSTALLATCGYDLRDGEVVSEDPRAAEVAISVHATHHLE